jgi:peptidyl-prolyl cis-trans isomerase C
MGEMSFDTKASMPKARRMVAALAAGAIGVIVASSLSISCSRRQPGAGDKAADGGASFAGDPAGGQAAKVLARVGSRTISVADFVATLERMDQFDRLRYQSPERRKELLQEIVDTELLAQDAREKGLDKLPETQQAIRQILRDALLLEARKGLPAPADIPQEEVRAFYESHRDDFREPARRRVAHIALADRAGAEGVLAAARTVSVTQWGELVRKHSLDAQKKPSPTQPIEMAGDLGIVGSPSDPRGDNPRVPAEVRAAVFELGAVNDVYPRPVQAQGRWHIVRLTGKTDAHDRSLAEADRTIRVSLLQAKIAEREKALEAELRKQFPVVVDEQALGSVAVPSVASAQPAGTPAPNRP